MATLAERLAEAEAAHHELLTGRGVVEVTDSNGESLRYQQASIGRLASYISDLRRQIGGGGRVTTIQFETRKGV